MRALQGVLIMGCAVIACTSPDSTEAVDWENYSPTVRERIDAHAASADCDGLQHEFDVAEMNNAAQRDRTGDGNADLMSYIHGKMQVAGCYD